VASNNLLGRGSGAIVDHDDLERWSAESLYLEAAEAGFQSVGLIKAWEIAEIMALLTLFNFVRGSIIIPAASSAGHLCWYRMRRRGAKAA
jgi:hypothetical protein